MDILIINGLIIDPASKVHEMLDILVSNGKIVKLGKQGAISTDGTKVIDAKGKIVVPGLVDMHVHLREPGFEYKETIATGTAAAKAGGFTAVCCMPNTKPINDSRTVTEYILAQARNMPATVFPIGAITKGSKGAECTAVAELRAAGCVALSDDGRSVMNSAIMRAAMDGLKRFDMPVISHCEDENLAAGGVMNEGEISKKLNLKGIPHAAEDIMVARDIALAELTGCRLHVAHVSTAGAVRLVRDAKDRGVKVTAETCPHYFTLTDEAVREYNAMAKMNPPLRTPRDVDAVKQGLKDGTIDVIATDHAPHSTEEKAAALDRAAFGIVGLETAVGLSLRLVDEGVLSLSDVIRKLSLNPATALKLNKGTLSIGSDADITIIDLDEKWVVDAPLFRSKARNTPFNGWELKGRAVQTLLGGKA